MFYYVLFLLLVIPALEITLFIFLGSYVGPWWIFVTIILSGIIGITFAKQQGLETWRKAQESMRKGLPPGNHLLDSVCVIFGGILLFIPGFFTDIIGFFLIIPFTRKPFRNLLKYMIMKQLAKQKAVYKMR